MEFAVRLPLVAKAYDANEQELVQVEGGGNG